MFQAPGSPEGIRPPMPGSPGGSRPTSPRAHLRNITNNEPKSPRSKVSESALSFLGTVVFSAHSLTFTRVSAHDASVSKRPGFRSCTETRYCRQSPLHFVDHKVVHSSLYLASFPLQMTQLVNSLSRPPPRPMSPGRSALSAQLQQLAANRLAHTAAQQPEAPAVFGHDPIETGDERQKNTLLLVSRSKLLEKQTRCIRFPQGQTIF